MKKRIEFFILIAIVVLALMIAPAFATFAQDGGDLVTNTPAATEEVTLAPEPTAVIEPTIAPESTPAPPAEPSPFEAILADVNWTIVILAVALAFFGFLAYVVKIVGASAPAALWEGGKATVRATYDDIDKLVAGTSGEIDDALWQSLRNLVEQLMKDVDADRAKLTAGVKTDEGVSASRAALGAWQPQYPADNEPQG